jgi:hypothetical protein
MSKSVIADTLASLALRQNHHSTGTTIISMKQLLGNKTTNAQDVPKIRKKPRKNK